MLNPEIQWLIKELEDHLCVHCPSVEWEVSHGGAQGSLEPLVNISAGRHRFLQSREPRVQRTFRLWDSLNPANGHVVPRVWTFWAYETLEELQCAEP
jgi:hypothetical protein